MSNYTTLKTTINANIRQNGNQEITGKILNSVLNEMVNTLGEGYQFAGIAIMETDPGTPDAKVFYIANGKGTYTNFGGLEVTEDEVVFLVWDKSWHKVATGIAADAKLKEAVKELTEIAGKVDTKQDIIPDLEAIREGAGKGNEASSTIASIVEAGYVFAGIATPETNPGTPDTKVFYIAKGKGTYTSFSGIEVTEDEVVALCWDSLWNKVSTGIASDQKLSELEGKVNGKQDALTLTVKDNGNIVISNIQGQSKEFMPATPSGDPMHYAYVSAGAVWNGTGADIIKTAPWADLADDDADKTVVHKAGYWYLNGLGNITNDEMRLIYNEKYVKSSPLDGILISRRKARSAIIISSNAYTTCTAICLAFGCPFESLAFTTNLQISDLSRGFADCTKLKSITGFIGKYLTNTTLSFANCVALKFLSIKALTKSVVLSDSPKLTNKSILYVILNEVATSPITITLHADAYARAMANAEILAALEAHSNVSLASA